MQPRYLRDFAWSELEVVRADTLVIGSGVAGLYTALKAAEAREVVLLTKRTLGDSNTAVAQGGIAAAVGSYDSPLSHLEDTLEAGVELCDRAAVEVLVREGPDCVMDLAELGVPFDREGKGFALGREGAHSQRRILHAGGDATGGMVAGVLARRARAHPRITIKEGIFTVDLLTAENQVVGVLAYGGEQGYAFLAGKTVLATGGAGQLYTKTTNPLGATGDGAAMAYRAGASLSDLEFIQFHPTVLALPGAPPFLLSEAVRGDGAVLVNDAGERFAQAYHPLGELAPRDVVSRAIADQLAQGRQVYLDAGMIGRGRCRRRFPTISSTLASFGLTLGKDPIPVAPAAHYTMGGVHTDVEGRTGIRGLYAVGEVASVGIHGANRLASNSLLEGLVFGRRVAKILQEDEPVEVGEEFSLDYVYPHHRSEADAGEIRRHLQEVMTAQAGILRSLGGLKEASEALAGIDSYLTGTLSEPEHLETANLLTLAELVVASACRREESRGAHFRADFPKAIPMWQGHILHALSAEGDRQFFLTA